MADGDKPPEGVPVLGLAAEEQPFDKWLRMQLHAMFDGVVNEPLPADLVRIIDEDAERVRQEAAGNAAPKPPSDKS
jgi:hypothetical protein